MAKQSLEEQSLETLKAGNLTKQALTTIMTRVNNHKHEIPSLEDEITLDAEHIEQGRAWLYNLAWTPTGKVRKNNPFGYREESILQAFETITLSDFYNHNSGYGDFYTPVYTVKSKQGFTFSYTLRSGGIYITG
jgi:hypothetical protein